MAKEKTNWVKWVDKKIGEHPADTNKFGLFAQEYAFYRGDQYRVWDQKLGLLREVNISRETRCIYNICRPFVNMFVAKMMKGDPVPNFQPYPQNTEQTDVNLATIGNGMSQYWWKTVVEGGTRLRHQCQWGGMTGIGIGKIYYDKNKYSGRYQGEIEWETIDPFHFFPNPDARNDDELRWVIHRFPKEKSVVEDEFNKERGSLKADEKQSVEEKRISGGKHVDDYISQSDEDTVFVHDIWIKECKDYPYHEVELRDKDGKRILDENGKPKTELRGGKHVIVAGGETLVEEDNSEPDMLPFFTFRVKALPDEFYGEGILKDILTIQRDMNRCESVVQGNVAFMGNTKWLINRKANISPSALNNEEFEKVEYDDTQPIRDQGVPVPEQISGRWWDLWRKAMSIVGFSEAGRGDIPYRGSQTSPGVIKELKQSEDVLFAQDVAELTDYVRRIMRRYFFLAKKYYAEPRIVEIVGENKRPEAHYFIAQDFIKDPDFDIAVGSGFSQSREARMDQMIQWAQTGIFDKIPGIDWRVIGEELLNYADLNKISEETYKDERQARRNLDQILQLIDVPVSPYVNLAVHVKVFIDFIKTPEYDPLTLEQKTSIDNYIAKVQSMMQPPPMPMLPNMGPGNNKPQIPTASEGAEMGANRRSGTGQPVPEMGQGEYPSQGV